MIMTEDEAEQLLSQKRQYDWLTRSDIEFWTVQDIAGKLNVPESTVLGWIRSKLIEDVVFYTKQTGYRIPRLGLMKYLASTIK